MGRVGDTEHVREDPLGKVEVVDRGAVKGQLPGAVKPEAADLAPPRIRLQSFHLFQPSIASFCQQERLEGNVKHLVAFRNRCQSHAGYIMCNLYEMLECDIPHIPHQLARCIDLVHRPSQAWLKQLLAALRVCFGVAYTLFTNPHQIQPILAISPSP